MVEISIKIGDTIINKNAAPFIIAEAGINHNGDLELAKRMICAAKEAGVDAVKFQTFKTEEFIQDKTEMYTYRSQGREVTESQYEMFKRTEFSDDEWREIKGCCDEKQVNFLSTVSGIEGINFLVSLGVGAIKVGSDDFVNIPLLSKYEKYGLPMIVSCGMAMEEEISAALNALNVKDGHPVSLMLCTSEYPTPAEDVNIRKLVRMAERFPDVILGLSDHTQGNTAAIMAIAYGARIFEKHFTLDHNLPGPDHWFSADPIELREWVDSIRTAYTMLGSCELEPTEAERKQRDVMHRSMTAVKDIAAGERFSEENIALLRPGNGIGALHWDAIIGRHAKTEIKRGSQIRWDEVGS